ncbi:hypothetical protein B0T14DRAFT_530826 [Immersiella caudata]|uniref:Uncharacterized protein n=1 Tax=Immersiella caudata TaxID=314043 RepID=A0AA39WB71_9PEZI|nr:hypothetical protein B0T14DRAFT_530826 [Immersiella caudata]
MQLSKLFFLATLLATTTTALPQRGGGDREAQGRGRGKGRPGNRPEIRPPQNPDQAPPPPPGAAPPPPPNGGGNNNGGGGNNFAGGPGDASQVNTAVIPNDFGIQAGSGVGANNVPIPADCPPSPSDPRFLGGLAALLTQGFFPDPSVPAPLDLAAFNNAADQSQNTVRQRATAMVQVMQSISGTKGVGCPGASFPVVIAQQQTGVVA